MGNGQWAMDNGQWRIVAQRRMYRGGALNYQLILKRQYLITLPLAVNKFS